MSRHQVVTIERVNDTEWLVLHASGRVENWGTPEAALRSVGHAAKRGNRAVTITTIEWRSVAPGWRPPTP